MEIQRYDWIGDYNPTMEPHEFGDYVKWDDVVKFVERAKKMEAVLMQVGFMKYVILKAFEQAGKETAAIQSILDRADETPIARQTLAKAGE